MRTRSAKCVVFRSSSARNDTVARPRSAEVLSAGRRATFAQPQAEVGERTIHIKLEAFMNMGFKEKGA
jgi:hypothetical protein